MQLITFADKVALNENPSIAAENKVRDVDMNEIKDVINNQLANGWCIATGIYATTYTYNSTNKTLTISTNRDTTDYLGIGTKIKFLDNGVYKYGFIVNVDSSGYTIYIGNQGFDNIDPSIEIIYSYDEAPQGYPFSGEAILYNNPSGTNADFTLSDSIANYRSIKITYTDNNGDCFRIVELPTSNCFDNLSIYGCYQDTNGTHMVIRNSFINFSGTNATWTASRCCYMDITTNTQNVQSGNYIYIRQVIGCK